MSIEDYIGNHLTKDLAKLASSHLGPIDIFKSEYKYTDLKDDENLPNEIQKRFFAILQNHVDKKWIIDIYDKNDKLTILYKKDDYKYLTSGKIDQDNDMIKVSLDNQTVVYLTDTNWNKYDKILKRQEYIYTNILFIGPVRIIGDYWVSQYIYLETVSFHGLNNLRKINNRWLSNCTKLKNIDFNGLFNLTHVEDDWLYFSSPFFPNQPSPALTNINFIGLNKLYHVGNTWMFGYRSIKEINFNGLDKLNNVGNYWIKDCKELENVLFRGLGNLTSVGEQWLSGCASIKEISFNGLEKLENVGEHWIFNCSNLTTVNFMGLSSLKSIKGDLLSTYVNFNSKGQSLFKPTIAINPNLLLIIVDENFPADAIKKIESYPGRQYNFKIEIIRTTEEPNATYFSSAINGFSRMFGYGTKPTKGGSHKNNISNKSKKHSKKKSVPKKHSKKKSVPKKHSKKKSKRSQKKK